jgi:glycosyltransferase involved in cell wall biosynthesis
MKNVLLVSFHFPPDAAVGGFRAQKFAKYLPQHGWTPHVLTVKERHYSALDRGRIADVVGVSIHRTGMLPSPLAGLVGARNALLRVSGRAGALERRAEANARMTFEQRDRIEVTMAGRLRRLVLSLGRMPDDQIGWLVPAVSKGLRICREAPIHAIVTSGPPQTGHLIGLWLKRFTGLRWIADFRDPWIGNPGKPHTFRSRMSDRLEKRMESSVVRSADRIVLLTDSAHASLARRYPGEPATKFVTILNGFDADDFSSLPPIAPELAFTVAHVGSLYFHRSPVAFLTAIANLVEHGKIPPSDIQVVFAGEVADGHDVAGWAAAGLLAGVIRIIGPVGHREALAWMRRADLLCLFAQGQREQIPAKVFEYLAAGAPILAITGEGSTGNLVSRAGGAVVPDESWAIEDAIYQQYLKYQAGARPASQDLPWAREEIRPYDRRHLAGQMAALLESRG